jgi:hypothetical protein
MGEFDSSFSSCIIIRFQFLASALAFLLSFNFSIQQLHISIALYTLIKENSLSLFLFWFH